MEIDNNVREKYIGLAKDILNLTKKIEFGIQQNQFKCIFCGSKPLDRNISEYIRVAITLFFICIGVLITVLGGIILIFWRYFL